MPTLLHLDVSPRGDHSVSRNLSAAFAKEWKAKNPDGSIVYRDLAAQQIPFVDLPWITGAYSAPEQHTPEQKGALKVSDELINELMSANEVVIGTPFYNFSIPARLKAWIDHIVRLDKTFTSSYQGLVTGRKTTVIVASGGSYGPGAHMEAMNFVTPYLKAVFGFIGITDLKFILAGDTRDVAMGKVPMDQYLPSHLEEVAAAV